MDLNLVHVGGARSDLQKLTEVGRLEVADADGTCVACGVCCFQRAPRVVTHLAGKGENGGER